MVIGTYILIITLKVNGLNAPTKRHRLAECIQKPIYMGYIYGTHIYAVYKTPTSDLKTHIVCVREWKNTFHANGKQKKAGVGILISDKIHFTIKKILRDKEGQYIMIKESIQEEDKTIVNIYVSNIGAPQYIRQTIINIRRN